MTRNHVREELAATYDENGNFKNATTFGKIIANNTGTETMRNVTLSLDNLTKTNITGNVTLAELLPGETVVKTYSVQGQPRLVLNETWRSITYENKLNELRSTGKLSDGAFARYANNFSKVLFGQDNLLEFNVTIENRGQDNLTNITLEDLLPEGVISPQGVAAPGVQFIGFDSALIDNLGPGEGRTS